MKIHKEINLEIEALEKKALEYFVEWFTYSQKKFSELSPSIKRAIKAQINEGIKHNKMGELFVAAWLINQKYDIGWSNIHLKTFGKAEERGVDLMVEKNNKYFFAEVKTNETNNRGSIISLVSSVMSQLDKRIQNSKQNLVHMYDCKWFQNKNDQEYNKLLSWIEKNIEGMAFILSPKIHPDIDKPRRHNFYYGKLSLEKTSETAKELKKEIYE